MVSRQNKTEPREFSTGRKTVQPVIKAVAWIDRQTERRRLTRTINSNGWYKLDYSQIRDSHNGITCAYRTVTVSSALSHSIRPSQQTTTATTKSNNNNNSNSNNKINKTRTTTKTKDEKPICKRNNTKWRSMMTVRLRNAKRLLGLISGSFHLRKRNANTGLNDRARVSLDKSRNQSLVWGEWAGGVGVGGGAGGGLLFGQWTAAK